MRRPRLKILHRPACYHVICRITQAQLWLGEEEKQYLMELLHRVSYYCGVEVLTFCVMSNHFHILLRVPEKPEADSRLDPQHLIKRVAHLYGSDSAEQLQSLLNDAVTGNANHLWEEEKAAHLGRMHDLSVFMKLLKQRFTMWYNHRHDTTGTIWTERFKSVLIEAGVAAQNPLHLVAAYIDLNPVRAEVAANASDYPFSGAGSAALGNRASQQGLRALMADAEPSSESATTYQALLATPEDHISEKPSIIRALRARQPAFVKGVILGSAAFVMEILSALVQIRQGVRPQAYAAGGTGGDLWVGQRFRGR